MIKASFYYYSLKHLRKDFTLYFLIMRFFQFCPELLEVTGHICRVRASTAASRNAHLLARLHTSVSVSPRPFSLPYIGVRLSLKCSNT